MQEQYAHKRRRRNCADRIRQNLARRRRRDPASKAMLQILELLSSFLVLLPEAEAFSRPRYGSSFRSDRRTPPPDYNLGVEAWERERGLERNWYSVSRSRPRPSWSRLVKDLSRRSARDRARVLIAERVPPEALGWLQEMIQTQDWIALRIVGHDSSDQDIWDRAMMASLRWELERQAGATASPAATDDAGAPGPALRPRF